jgi:hypothetical protein
MSTKNDACIFPGDNSDIARFLHFREYRFLLPTTQVRKAFIRDALSLVLSVAVHKLALPNSRAR